MRGIPRTAQASYTVEAAFIMPIILFAILKGILFGFELHEEQQRRALEIKTQEQFQAVETIRKYELLEDVLDKLTEEEKDADGVSQKSKTEPYDNRDSGIL